MNVARAYVKPVRRHYVFARTRKLSVSNDIVPCLRHLAAFTHRFYLDHETEDISHSLVRSETTLAKSQDLDKFLMFYL